MKTIEQLEVHDKTVLLRCDFNVPMDDGKVADTFRIEAVKNTVDLLNRMGAKKIVLISHFGRPQGEVKSEYSLEHIATDVKTILGGELYFIPGRITSETKEQIEGLPDGSMVLLDNLRFHPGEKANNEAYGRLLSSLGEVFINDAFSVCHREHASVIWPAKLVPSGIGKQIEKELDNLTELRLEPKQPFVLLIGGVKIKDKMAVIQTLGQKAEKILIGGGIANTMLKASGVDIKDSLVIEEEVPLAATFFEKFGDRIMLPIDVVVAKNGDGHYDHETLRSCDLEELQDKEAILDIGPKSRVNYLEELRAAGSVFWAGPMGYIEWEETAITSNKIAGELAAMSNYSAVGGGETVSVVSKSGVRDKIDFVSTGGGAALAYLANEKMPGLEVFEH